MSKSKKSTKSKASKSVAAKVSTASKSAAVPTAAQKQVRSMAAYKAHMTRQTNALNAAKKPEDKAAARKSIEAIAANMKQFAS
jgi:hypothetical protein